MLMMDDETLIELRALRARAYGPDADIDADCLTVVPAGAVSQDGSSIKGQMYYGCAAGAFPAVAQFTISETSPDELQEAFGLGTSLQFVLAPEGVGVFADPPRPTPSVSASIVAG